MPKSAKMNFKAGDTVRVNVRTSVNSDAIRHEERDGRKVVVVKSATLPDDVVMNGIMYPAAEIEKGYKTLENTPAPLGHPTVNDMFVSAKTPLGLNLGYFGAWNANVRRKDGRVWIDKIIDVERANESKMGKRVLAALEKGEPIHTSTGLLMHIRECTNSDLAEYEGYDMEFDHDAILLDEDGAATPEQGVGMMVNSAKGADGKKIVAINSNLEERMDEHIDMLGMELLSAIDRKEAASRWAQLKSAIMEAVGLRREETSTVRKEATDMAGENDGDFTKLNERLGKMEKSIETLTETVTNMADTQKEQSAALEAINADRKAAKDALVNKVVEAKLLDKETAEATPAKVLEAMLNAAGQKQEAPKAAPGIHGGFEAINTDNIAAFSPLGGEAKKEA